MKKNLVQKLVLVLLAGSMMVSMTACSGSSSNTSKADDSKKSEASEISNSTNNSDVITGGWENNSGALAIQSNAEAKEAFEKAVKDLKDGKYEAIALLGQQVVAGTNYSILVRKTTEGSDAKTDYEIVTVYQDLEGNAQITGSKVLLSDPEEGETGAFEVNTGDYDLSKNQDVNTVFEKGLEGLDGADYEAVAYLGNQVVGGTNYMVLMRITPVVLNAEPEFGLVTFNQDLDGNVTMLEVQDLELGTD